MKPSRGLMTPKKKTMNKSDGELASHVRCRQIAYLTNLKAEHVLDEADRYVKAKLPPEQNLWTYWDAMMSVLDTWYTRAAVGNIAAPSAWAAGNSVAGFIERKEE